MRPRSVLRHAGRGSWRWASYVRAIWQCGAEETDEAIALVRESLIRIRELHDKFAFVYALVPLAAAAVLKGDDPWAARILGARDAITERTGATVVDPSVHDLREQAEREVRARLGPDRWARAYAAGAGRSIRCSGTSIASSAEVEGRTTVVVKVRNIPRFLRNPLRYGAQDPGSRDKNVARHCPHRDARSVWCRICRSCLVRLSREYPTAPAD